jgi:Asp-tRNA(Asn)/Glu-tRNA(Gln) amidotransferase A subunit family amidase
VPLVMKPFFSAAPRFAAGDDSPRDFLERCLTQMAEIEPKVGAFVHTNLDGARDAADRATARWRDGKALSRIDGMPVGIKDIIETADMPTENGSPLFKGWQSGRDAATVAALRDAGAVIVGKTVTTEFAATEPRGTRNPRDLSRTPGGSSSGSAAAVASGMLSAALGTQVIGSILRPASYCGCVGFKPSLGAINRGGSHDGLSQSSHGVLAATLEDAWLVTREISARAGGDPGSPGLAGPRDAPAARKPRRLAMLATAGWETATAAARQALDAMLDRIKSAGVEIVLCHDNGRLGAIETALKGAMPLSRRINAWESRWPLNIYRQRDATKLSRTMLDRLAEAEAMSLEDYQALIAERQRIRQLYAVLAADVDACVTLAASGAAPVGLASTGDPAFAVPSSLLGVPALSLPVMTCEGLPLGLQIMGFEQQDAAAVAIAAWLVDHLASGSLGSARDRVV